MKIYIFFMAFLIAISQFIVFHQNFNRYLIFQEFLKEISEECAIRAALLIDEETSGNGAIIFLKDKTDAYEYMDYASGLMGLSGKWSLELSYEDDSTSYSENNLMKTPRVTAKVTMEAGDLFKNSHFKKNAFSRTSCYELL